jgi:hypothetical protein
MPPGQAVIPQVNSGSLKSVKIEKRKRGEIMNTKGKSAMKKKQSQAKEATVRGHIPMDIIMDFWADAFLRHLAEKGVIPDPEASQQGRPA